MRIILSMLIYATLLCVVLYQWYGGDVSCAVGRRCWRECAWLRELDSSACCCRVRPRHFLRGIVWTVCILIGMSQKKNQKSSKSLYSNENVKLKTQMLKIDFYISIMCMVCAFHELKKSTEFVEILRMRIISYGETFWADTYLWTFRTFVFSGTPWCWPCLCIYEETTRLRARAQKNLWSFSKWLQKFHKLMKCLFLPV